MALCRTHLVLVQISAKKSGHDNRFFEEIFLKIQAETFSALRLRRQPM